MITFEAVCVVAELEPAELEQWIHERWVLPESASTGWVFQRSMSRIRLIKEMKHDLAIDEEAMPVVLRLLDQVYALRRRLKELSAAIEALPPEIRATVLVQLKEPPEC